MLEKYPGGGQVRDLTGVRLRAEEGVPHQRSRQAEALDGRGYQDLRPITCEVGVLPRAHGSAIFQRGETQALALATLAPIEEAQNIDAYGGGETSKSFLLHYNFPPFSVGETGRIGGASRREIGHGALAERSLEPVVPSAEDFRYAIRITSEIMESNGSTSMASVCGGMLALMDAGVPIKTPVAGISVGLVTEYDESGKLKRYELLTDIIGSEDHFGDMDFKLCGTEDGITGFQLDLKLPGRQPQDHGRSDSSRQGSARQRSSGSWRGARQAARRSEQVRAAHRDDQDQSGEDRRAHRTRRQNDQGHRRRDRRGDQHRRRRLRAHLRDEPREHGAREGNHRRHDDARSKSARSITVASSRSKNSAPSSKCSRARTASSTSPSWPTSA